MMKKNIIATLLCAITLSIGFSSCEDMLTGDMDRHIEIDELAQDTLYSYWGILRSLQHVAERYVILGECRGDLVDGTQYVSDSINAILEFGLTGSTADGSNRFLKAADFYHVVNSCNAYLYRADTATVSGLNRPLMLSEYAQVATIRAWAYLQLVLNYGRVPYFEKPMLSTADMEDFRKAAQYIDANTLATSGVAQLVDKLRYVPTYFAGDSIRVIGYPNYYNYGRTQVIAHSSQCIFPQDVVLGDMYLLRAQGEGSEADYRLAAQHYYNFLNSEKGGPLLPNTLQGFMEKDMRTEQYQLRSGDWINMYRTRNATSKSAEIVTIIPSNTNKLWGEVLRGINELFGFEATIRVNTSTADTVTTASISLRREFEHQLDASKAYFNLNKSQNFEAYIGPEGKEVCTVLPGAGDARYWMATTTYTDYDKGAQEEATFVQKQNPGGTFTTTYPVIYRKASIWLHFAEALNGAGFPGFAFAILRHGLIGTEQWVPTEESDYAFDTFKYYDPTLATEDADTTFFATIEDLYETFQEGLDTLTTSEDSVAFISEHTGRVGLTRSQIPAPGGIVCDYISRREMEKAKGLGFLDFNTYFLRGETGNTSLDLWSGITEYGLSKRLTDQNPAGPMTMGIHQRGNGPLKMLERQSTYNYIDQINKMLALYEGQEEPLTEAEIYDPNNLRTVQKAIAALILDELALETSFEGNRFFDLLTYSRFIGGTQGVERVAKKISERSGESNNALYSHLLNQSNWYFKLPM